MEVAAQPNVNTRKLAIGIALIAVLAVIIFLLPPFLGKSIAPMVQVSAFVLVVVYVLLSFEFLHRSSIALIGAISVIAAASALQTIPADESFEFVVGRSIRIASAAMVLMRLETRYLAG